MGFEHGLDLTGTKRDKPSACVLELDMQQQGSVNPAGGMINLLQWLNFPILPSLAHPPFNILSFLGNQGALTATVSPATPSNLMHQRQHKYISN